MTTPADPALLPLRRGTVLRRFNPGGSDEVGVVLGPSSRDSVKCAHGWVDDRPDVGTFAVDYEHLRRGLWRVATTEDAAKVRALFLAHAQDYGPDSAAWAVVNGESGTWQTPPVAMLWEPSDVSDDRRAALEALTSAEHVYLLGAKWTVRGDRWVDQADGVAWPRSTAIAIQRDRDEEHEPEPPLPTPEHAAAVREQVRQIVARPKRRWVRDRGAERWLSDDGRYEIWVQSRPRGDGVCYGAMPLPAPPDLALGKHWLGVNFSFREAKEACEEHALKAAQPGRKADGEAGR